MVEDPLPLKSFLPAAKPRSHAIINKRGNSLGDLRHHIKEFLIANVPHMSKGQSQSTTTPVRQMSSKYCTPSTPSASIWRIFVSLQPPNNLRG